MNYKTCTKCKKPLPATSEFFGPEKRVLDGFKTQCRRCCNQLSRKYYKNNKEKHAITTKKWKKANPDKVAAQDAKYRARKLNQTPKLTDSEDKRIELFYKKSQGLGSDWQVDHIQPLSKKGLHHPNNLQIVTKTYNLEKSDKLDFRLPTKKEIYKWVQ